MPQKRESHSTGSHNAGSQSAGGAQQEAQNLAKEVVEEIRHGNKEEGEFLAEEARALDGGAAAKVLDHRSGEKPAGRPDERRHETHGQEARHKGAGRHGGSGQTTTDHDAIREWAEARNGRPSVVKATEGEDHSGLLRIEFDRSQESLDEVSWEEFFRTFDDRKLAFLYQEETADGKQSRFFKFIRRDER